MTNAPSPKPSFKAQMLKVREEAIVQSVNRLLAEKGFDAMTVDEVAADVGIAKASLYKHFPGKEDLACAAMIRVIRRTQDYLNTLPADMSPLDKLKDATRWALQVQLAGEMPSLPSQNSRLRATLMANSDYMGALIDLSDQLGGWIEAAQATGAISRQLPAIAVLYTLYARACDPVVDFLKAGGQYSHAQIVDLVVGTCFDGLNAR
ncbi:MAG: TetR/AcrR family transcriptional regulator [Burkholderiales bacterium]|nr:MAG: TetR/AcrR family transcriptional regulator [Burkholderiales bacterium]